MQTVTMEKIRQQYREVCPTGHWFDVDALRFFSSRLPQTGVQCADGSFLFVTSEQCRATNQPRAYSLRCLDGTGMETLGEFQGYATRQVAMRALRAEVAKRG